MVATVDNAAVAVPEKDAKTLMAEGRRDFICKDYSAAAENFSKAVEGMTLEFGDRAQETAEGYFWYGKSLLEVSRNQQDFLGTKAENEDVENVDPEGETGEASTSKLETVTEEMAATSVEKSDKNEPQEAPKATDDPEIEAKEEKESTENTENNGENETNEENENNEDQENGEESGEGSEGEEEDDVTDQQLAYEMFEMARGIFEALPDSSPESEQKRAECHMSIGEIAGENGQLEEAIQEYDAALEIFQKCLPVERRRRIAEVYFSLGCAQDAIYHYGKSLTSFERALETMQERIDFLKAKPEDTLKAADRREITSLVECIVPELKERIEDAKLSGQKHEADKEMLKQVLLQKSTTNAFDPVPQSSSSSSSKPVSSLNHLIKRKRKSVDAEGGASSNSNGVLEPSAKRWARSSGFWWLSFEWY